MAEAIDIVLSATDNATAVIQKSAGQMELLRDRVDQTSKSTAKGSESIQKFANVLGAGWITDSAAQLKELSEAGKGAMEALKGGGSGALALKAGLVGLVGYGSFAVTKMIRDWWEETDKWSASMKDAAKQAEELDRRLNKESLSEFAKGVERMKKGLSLEDQQKAITEWATQFEKEIAGVDRQIKESEKIIDEYGTNFDRWGKAISNRFSGLELLGLDEKLPHMDVDPEQLKAQIESDKARVASMREYLREQMTSISQVDIEAEKQSQAIKAKEEAEKQALDNRKKLTEAFFKFQEDMAKQYAKEEEKQQKAKEKATLKQKDLEIKAASEAIKATQKEISDLEKVKIDTNTSLQGREERVLSRSTDAGGLPAQQLANSKKQTMILEKQRELEEKIERHLKLMAEKEDKVVEFSGA